MAPSSSKAGGRGASRRGVPEDDLRHVFEKVAPLWEELRGARLFITGGTGFFGKWLLESLLHANRCLGLGCQVTVLSRDPARFAGSYPHLADPAAVSFVAGDVRDFPYPEGEYRFVIHAATDVAAESAPLDLFSACLDGTRRVLDFARLAGCRDFLLASSGAVYGRQPQGLAALPETHGGGPDPLAAASAYGEGKRCAEWLAGAYGREHRFGVKIARCFAFVGPYLPLDRHYAIGNFIGDAASGRGIVIKGDGTPCRSYLYAADLAVWLWRILLRGKGGEAYNVGGDEPLSMAELAQRVARLAGSGEGTRVLTPGEPAREIERYIPDVRKAKDELGVQSWVPLDRAIEKTLQWVRECDSPAGGQV